MTGYQPPYAITPLIIDRIASVSESIGRFLVLAELNMTPHLRRKNRIRTIQASLAIENNTLSVEQVTAVIDGKHVLGEPREIQEVRNAFSAYEAMTAWDPGSMDDLLKAHELLMMGLVDHPGAFRKGGAGIYRGDQLIHLAPPADRVPHLVSELLSWLKQTDVHPLVASCVFHYELEFIHPFVDGNGRMGRLWQTLILRQWKSILAYLPVETVIRDRQVQYYQSLAKSDQDANATPFIEFMLDALNEVLINMEQSEQVTAQVTAQVEEDVRKVMMAIGSKALGITKLMAKLELSHREHFRKQYLRPALDGGWVERTQPDSPRSPSQQYRLTQKGLLWLDQNG